MTLTSKAPRESDTKEKPSRNKEIRILGIKRSNDLKGRSSPKQIRRKEIFIYTYIHILH